MPIRLRISELRLQQNSTINKLLFISFILLSITRLSLGTPCKKNFWWNQSKNSCIECTQCDSQMVVLRPCQHHKDTVCGTVNDLEFDWSWLARTEKQNQNWKDRRKETEISYRESDEILLDWQAAILGLAALACLLFVFAAIYISVHQLKQLKKIQKRLNKDYEELYATLTEVQNLENGAIVIDDPFNKTSSMGTTNPIEVQCIYLEQLLAGKKSKKFPGTGNLYIEETSNNTSK